MSFVRTILGKPAEDVGLSDIQTLIGNKVEEGHHLEYKGGQTLVRAPEDLSKWVSAFLNAEGGLIVIGVTEDHPDRKNRLNAKIYPQEIDYAPPGFTRERVEQIVYSNIRGDDVPDISILPIRGEADNCVYLIDVPQGQAPPYQAADRKYYKRLNFTKWPMEHYEIADFFGRRRKPRLHVDVKIMELETPKDARRFTTRFALWNDGRAAARHVEFSASFGNAQIERRRAPFVSRLDNLRGVPSIQWTKDEGVIHPGANRRTDFGDLRITQQDANRPVTLEWDLVAEDFELTEGRFEFDDEFFQHLPPDRPYISLPSDLGA